MNFSDAAVILRGETDRVFQDRVFARQETHRFRRCMNDNDLCGSLLGDKSRRVSGLFGRQAGYSLKWDSGEEGGALQCRSMSALACWHQVGTKRIQIGDRILISQARDDSVTTMYGGIVPRRNVQIESMRRWNSTNDRRDYGSPHP